MNRRLLSMKRLPWSLDKLKNLQIGSNSSSKMSKTQNMMTRWRRTLESATTRIARMRVMKWTSLSQGLQMDVWS